MPERLSLEDADAIHEVIARYAHIVDNPGIAERLHLVFADTIILEAAALGRVSGLDAVTPIYAALEEQPRRDHHTNGTIITSVDAGRVSARSHFIAVWHDGKASSGDYLDVLEKTSVGWRIVERKIVNRLPPPDVPEPEDVYVGWEME